MLESKANIELAVISVYSGGLNVADAAAVSRLSALSVDTVVF